MSLEKVFAVVDQLRNTMSVHAAFGEPQQVEGKVLIPVARVSMAMGLGFGQGISPQDEKEPAQEGDSGSGGGGGGGGGVRPLAVIQVTPEETTIKPIMDKGKIALAGLATIAWVVFWLLTTLRAIFGKD